MKRMLTLAFAVAAVVVSADTWWVKKDGGVDAAGYGTAEATPFRTIQYAVTAAAAGDTIMVEPGVYDEGYGLTDSVYTNRINITKDNLTLKSTGGADVTHIVGAKDPNGPRGIGPAAIRCICTDHSNIIIEGFTIRDGAAFVNADLLHANGGAILAGSTSTYLVDCVVSNCAGVRGGAMYRGSAVRCRFTDNYALVKGAAGRESRFFNCLIVRNESQPGGAMATNCRIVNCTLGDFYEGIGFSESSRLDNTVVSLVWSAANGYAQNATCDVSSHSLYNSVVPYDHSRGGDAFFKTFEDGYVVTNLHLFKAPALGDYRLLPGTVAVTAGNAAQLALYDIDSRIDRWRDLNGEPIPQTGTIAAGCYQRLASAPVSGALAFGPNIEVGGRRICASGSYFYPDAYPTQIWIKAAPPEGSHTLRFTQTATDGFSSAWAPMTMDERLLLLPPRAVGNTLTTSLTHTPNARYVDPNSGDDDGNDGLTAATPFKTIQHALTSLTQAAVVYCAAGEYDEGGLFSNGVTNRISHTASYAVRFVGAGADRTVIRGAADTTSEGRSADGRGPAAIRCVYASGSCMFQGFTFADGHSSWDGAEGGGSSSQGGGILNGYTKNYLCLTDCVITNCSATRGGAMYRGLMFRSRVTDCFSTVCGLREVSLYACLIDNNQASSTTTKLAILGPDAPLWYCTIVGRTKDEYLFDGNDPMTNTIIMSTCGIGATTPRAQGCYAWDIKSYTTNPGVPRRDPQFADAVNGDYAILASSPAAGGGVEIGDTAYQYWTPDYDGCPVTFVGMRPTAGAFQRLRPACSAAAVYGGFEGYGSGVTNAVAHGESMTVTYTNGLRRCLGLTVNGEFMEGVYSYTYTAPADATASVPAGRITAEVFSPDWYVDAVNGSDANDGFTPATAKRTLADAMTNTCLLAGDTVHALPGTYDEGSQLMGYATVSEPSTTTRSRVVVPNNVALVSTDGPEKTFIMGAPAASDANEYGMGAGAVRCAGIKDNSRIEGFTLTGGRTGATNQDADDYDGAAALCYSRTTSQIVDCIISNNASVRRIVVKGTCINCRILENTVTVNSILRDGYLYSCVVDRNRGAYTAYSLLGIYNCTFGPDNKTLSGGNTDVVGGTPCPLYNSLCLCYVGTNYRPSNCALLTGSTMPSAANRTNCIVMAQADYMLDGDLRPTSLESPLVDAGSNAWLIAEAAATDVLGGQRVYNGRVDIGAHEFDWRARYAQLLGGGSRLAVTNASPDAVAVAGGVKLTEGASLGIEWRGEGGGQKTEYRFTAALDGEGALAAELNGGAAAPVQAGEQRFVSTASMNALGFAYAGEGSATLSAFSRRTFGTTILFR